MKSILTALALALATPVLAGGDEVFLKTGTLSDYDRSSSITYDQTVVWAPDPTLADREIGEVRLTADPADEGMVALTFHKGDGQRRLGAFPQSVGNPLFMVFVEAVIRDMAGFTGGSPFYIRNRVKDALVNRTQITQATATVDGATLPVTIAEMVPFDGDPNQERMQGFGDLTFRGVLSEDVTGWYVSLDATATTEDGVLYQRHLELRP